MIIQNWYSEDFLWLTRKLSQRKILDFRNFHFRIFFILLHFLDSNHFKVFSLHLLLSRGFHKWRHASKSFEFFHPLNLFIHSIFHFLKRWTSFMKLSLELNSFGLITLINHVVSFPFRLFFISLEWYCWCISQFIVRRTFSGTNRIRESVPSCQLGSRTNRLFR